MLNPSLEFTGHQIESLHKLLYLSKRPIYTIYTYASINVNAPYLVFPVVKCVPSYMDKDSRAPPMQPEKK